MEGEGADDERMEDWFKEGSTTSEFEEGEVVRGRVVHVGSSEVLVDVGYKSEGAIPIEEFHRHGGLPKVGDEIEVYLEAKEDNEGLIVLSKDKADKIKVWDAITQAYEKGSPVEGRVVEVVKGGLSVDVGVKAFLPGSQVDLRPVKNLAAMIGQSIRARVIKLNRRRGNVVLSRRAVLEEEREEKKKHTLEVLGEGMVLTGTVKNITDYGAFIDLGGIDGLLHVTDMSWGRVGHPSEIFQVGDQVEVVVLHFDRESGRVSLGYKQKSSDPWERVETTYAPGTKVRGRVVSLTNYGAFVELEAGVEGLVHVSEMSWTRRVRHPSKIVNVGDEVDVIVLDVNRSAKRISLGMKQVEPDPWATIDQRYAIGSRVAGKVRNLTDFGAFIELEPGVDGLLHISDMSWTRSVGHPSEILKKGQEIESQILNIDKENKRISLGLKQVQPDPWTTVAQRFPMGSRVTGKVVRLTDFGAFVELEPGVDGLLHISDMSWTRNIGHPSELLKKGQPIDTQILNVDRENKRISLGLKQIQPDPWDSVASRYPMGSRVTGKVVRLTDFGAFVELEPGVDGLLHISQMSNRPIATPADILNVGDELTLMVIRVDPNERRIGLSLKELAAVIEEPAQTEGRGRHKGRKRRGGDDYDDEE
jgi:small subunit ribosomal protein S1